VTADVVERAHASVLAARHDQAFARDLRCEVVARAFELLETAYANPVAREDALALASKHLGRVVPVRFEGMRAGADSRFDERLHAAVFAAARWRSAPSLAVL
jgi:hypothetical protein